MYHLNTSGGMKPQMQLVLDGLEAYGSLSPKQANRLFGVANLRPRICELRDLGHGIRTQKMKTRAGHKYVLVD